MKIRNNLGHLSKGAEAKAREMATEMLKEGDSVAKKKLPEGSFLN
ncbi:hypothetical protein [Fibrobacter sp.]